MEVYVFILCISPVYKFIITRRHYFYRGGVDGQEDDAYRSLRERSRQLAELEDEIDQQLDCAKRNLKYVKEDETNRSFAYVTRDDLLAVFGDDCVFTIPKHYEDERIVKRQVSLETFFFYFVR